MRFGYCCAYCGNKPEVLHMEHVIPLARGGRHAIGNLVPACPPCNQSKGARFLTEWRIWKKAMEANASCPNAA